MGTPLEATPMSASWFATIRPLLTAMVSCIGSKASDPDVGRRLCNLSHGAGVLYHEHGSALVSGGQRITRLDRVRSDREARWNGCRTRSASGLLSCWPR